MARGITGGGGLRDRVAFDAPTAAADALGGKVPGWTESHVCAAALIYQSGNEALQAARLAGRQVLKVKVRSCAAARGVTTDHRLRNVRDGLASGVAGDPLPGRRWNITEVDTVTDRAWVWITIEGVGS